MSFAKNGNSSLVGSNKNKNRLIKISEGFLGKFQEKTIKNFVRNSLSSTLTSAKNLSETIV